MIEIASLVRADAAEVLVFLSLTTSNSFLDNFATLFTQLTFVTHFLVACLCVLIHLGPLGHLSAIAIR